MNPGQIVGFLWVVAVWFFLLSVFAFPISLAYWRARERADQEATEKALERTKQHVGDEHWWDA